jgi:predicted  nucleic acid-binding Zn-ribbon protein
MKLQDCKTKNEELKTEVERFRKINDLQAKLTNDLEKKLVDCRNKNEGLEASLTKIPKDRKVSFINLHQEHQNAQERITDLEEQLEKCRHMNKKLKKEIAMRDEEKLGRSDQQQEEDKKSEDKEDKTSGPSDDESGTSEGQKGVQGSMLREVERRLIESQVANANLKQELGDLQEEKVVLQDKMKKMNGMAERLRAAQTNYRGVKRELERLRNQVVG